MFCSLRNLLQLYTFWGQKLIIRSHSFPCSFTIDLPFTLLLSLWINVIFINLGCCFFFVHNHQLKNKYYFFLFIPQRKTAHTSGTSIQDKMLRYLNIKHKKVCWPSFHLVETLEEKVNSFHSFCECIPFCVWNGTSDKSLSSVVVCRSLCGHSDASAHCTISIPLSSVNMSSSWLRVTVQENTSPLRTNRLTSIAP